MYFYYWFWVAWRLRYGTSKQYFFYFRTDIYYIYLVGFVQICESILLGAFLLYFLKLLLAFCFAFLKFLLVWDHAEKLQYMMCVSAVGTMAVQQVAVLFCIVFLISMTAAQYAYDAPYVYGKFSSTNSQSLIAMGIN